VLALEDRTVPAANLFADATLLTGTLVTSAGSNVGATAESGELAPTAGAEPINSVWWRWTAPADGRVEVNTLGSDFDTVLAVRTGTAVNDLAVVGVNDDFFDTRSRVVFEAVAGTTYHISVDGFAAETGAVVLNLAMAPANDDFADAAVVTVGTYTGNNTGATAEPDEPSNAGTSDPVNSVWWTWTAPASGTVEFNTFGSGLDTLLAVYVGSSLDTLDLVTTNDDTDGLQSQVLFEAEAGTTYHIAVDGTLQFTGGIVLNRPETPGGTNRTPVVNDQTFTLDENSFGGTIVGTVAATDPDRSQTLTYDIIGGNTAGAFSINRGTGEIRVADGAALDYEVNPTFALLVRVTDGGAPALSDSAVVTVELANLHDAPDIQPAGPFLVAENSGEGTVVGTVSATDVDPGQTVRYLITGGNTSGAFAIDAATGVITVADPAALDYEANSIFLLTVTATDDDVPPLSSSAVVTVHVDDGNEPPLLIADQTFFVHENRLPGTLAAAVAATDPDGGQTLTYSIVGGDPAGVFTIDAATGRVTVSDSSLLNFEATPSFVLTVRVADDGTPGMSSDAAVTINLIDVNEAATFDGVGPFLVDEDAAAGTVVGTAAATDPDAATTLTYSITAGNAGAFAINPSTGEITVVNPAALDFETRSFFNLTVRVADDGTPALATSTSVVVMLNDVNDAPALDNTGAMSLAAINQGDFTNGGTLVSALLASAGGVRVTDQDAGAAQGIAVVAADTAVGSWQYSTDGGSSWLALGAVSNESARLLAADPLTRVRFVPAAGYNGTVAGGLTFRAWDRTTGENGGLADTSLTGGTSAFSNAVETASVKVRSAVEQIAILSADVQTLVSTGALAASDGNQLRSKLDHARRQLEQGNRIPAENQMNLFINLVSDLVQTGELDAALGDDLIAKAQAAIVSIKS
jgi:hypothetical protein